MMRDFNTIEMSVDGHLCLLALNRPEVMNAINQEMIDELLQALAALDKNEDVHVVIITGRGKAFQAGADIGELSAMTPLELLRWNEGLVRVNAAVQKLRQPVIAAINGAALGGGLELALACTMRVAVAGAKLGLPETKLGIIPGTGGTVRLPRLVGKGRAAELVLTGEIITAKEGERIGLINRLAPDGAPPEAAVEVAREIAKKILTCAPIAVEMAKDAIEVGFDLPIEQAVQYSQKNCVTCFSTEDMKEGTRAFLEKRPPKFQGK